jgi:hypothetical protein
MKNVIEFDSNIYDVMIGNTNDYTRLHNGVGESYGLETSLGYSDRRCDVQLNYTLSKSLRQFDEINEGKAFAAHSDRRHNLSFIASYKPSSRWTFASTFVYASGAPYTMLRSLYISGNAMMRDMGPYNGSRLPDLHHLDLSITYWFKCSRLKYSGINFSVYNVYAHANPTMVSWNVQLDDDVIHPIKPTGENGIAEPGDRYRKPTVYKIYKRFTVPVPNGSSRRLIHPQLSFQRLLFYVLSLTLYSGMPV